MASLIRIRHELERKFYYALPPPASKRMLFLSLSGLFLFESEKRERQLFAHSYEQLRVVRVINRRTIEFDFGKFGSTSVILRLEQSMHSLKFILADIVKLKKRKMEAELEQRRAAEAAASAS